eukprot:TRINITY_DN786_c1_g1_i7.p4 TRINITY_DN786_c1_g1~~TRINITY_DN786_c1_g1_i7.p4  ORF type:complete len:135 (+),score=5.24 TRINITY_DN786_c1_g1_i7:318-722(+)
MGWIICSLVMGFVFCGRGFYFEYHIYCSLKFWFLFSYSVIYGGQGRIKARVLLVVIYNSDLVNALVSDMKQMWGGVNCRMFFLYPVSLLLVKSFYFLEMCDFESIFRLYFYLSAALLYLKRCKQQYNIWFVQYL